MSSLLVSHAFVAVDAGSDDTATTGGDGATRCDRFCRGGVATVDGSNMDGIVRSIHAHYVGGYRGYKHPVQYVTVLPCVLRSHCYLST